MKDEEEGIEQQRLFIAYEQKNELKREITEDVVRWLTMGKRNVEEENIILTNTKQQEFNKMMDSILNQCILSSCCLLLILIFVCLIVLIIYLFLM